MHTNNGGTMSDNAIIKFEESLNVLTSGLFASKDEQTWLIRTLKNYVQFNTSLKQMITTQEGLELVCKSLLECSQQGLDPTDKHQVAIIPFNGNKPTLQVLPMYEGKLKLMYDSGLFKDVNADVVYENDKYEEPYIDEYGWHFKHYPSVKSESEKGKILFTWARATTINGGVYMCFMNEEELANSILFADKKAKSSEGKKASEIVAAHLARDNYKMFPKDMRRAKVLHKLYHLVPKTKQMEWARNKEESFTLPESTQTPKINKVQAALEGK